MPISSKSHLSSVRAALWVTLAVFTTLAVNAAGAGAQTSSGTASTPPDQNCAVTTARIGSLDVTQFFGVSSNLLTAPAGVTQSPVQRCLRLEVENPSPGDLVPVGGYVLAGFTFDPTVGAGQGTGISRVQVFLDDPNQGGAAIGGASAGAGTSAAGVGLPSARGAAFGDQFANSGFHLTAQIPSSAAGNPHAIFVVALANTGRVGTVAVPVVVGNLTPPIPTRTP